jgi:hypothetical protein
MLKTTVRKMSNGYLVAFGLERQLLRVEDLLSTAKQLQAEHGDDLVISSDPERETGSRVTTVIQACEQMLERERAGELPGPLTMTLG